MTGPRTHNHHATEQIRVLVPIGDVSALKVIAENRATSLNSIVREAIAVYLQENR